MPSPDTDVLIVGAGPTGLMLAGELGLAGVRALVVERLAEPMRQSRALGFSARAIEEFDQRGLLSHFGELHTLPMGHFGGLPLDYRVVPGGSYGARGKPQSLTESVLTSWALGLGAEIRRQHEVRALEQDAGGIRVEVTTPDGPRRITARYVAGCDGSRSAVRRLAGIDFPGTDPTVEMWFADVTGCELRPRFAGERVPGGMVMVLPLGPATNRVILHERGARRTHDGAPTFDEIALMWNRLTGEDISAATPIWTSVTSDASRQAELYRQGRVFVLGDAAHIHLPIGAQGMSAGIGDAVNLGWKLAAVVHGRSPADLLDSYHAERHPVGARVLVNTLAQRILYLGGNEMDPMRAVLTELLQYEEVRQLLVGMVTGLDIRYDMGSGEHPLLGRRLPDFELSLAAGDTVNAFSLLHAGRGVLLELNSPSALDAAAPWGDRVDVVAVEPGAGNVLGGVGAALLRPDGYLAWTGADEDGLADALARWFGNPCNDANGTVSSSRAAGARPISTT